MTAREGYLPVPGGMVRYRTAGAGPGRALLVLHGGPDAGSEYLHALDALGDARTVVYYDQQGGSDGLAPFVAEIDAVRRMLGLREVVLYGHSWGGWLAIEYLLGGGTGVAGVILASTSASIPQQAAEQERLRAAMPAEHARALGAGPDDPDYRAALLEFYRRHLCRLEDWPPALEDAVLRSARSPLYRAMLGPDELTPTGYLRDWDRRADLPRITVPALVTVGRHDEIPPPCARTLQGGLPDAELRVFEHSAHMPHLEEPGEYIDALREFLSRTDRPAGSDGAAGETEWSTVP